MFKINGLTGETSYSWRDTTIVCVMDIFYTEVTTKSFNSHTSLINFFFFFFLLNQPFLFHKPQQFALKWQETNDAEGINSGKNSKFCDKDRRLLWGSHGEKDMTKVADKYYELGKYVIVLCFLLYACLFLWAHSFDLGTINFWPLRRRSTLVSFSVLTLFVLVCSPSIPSLFLDSLLVLLTVNLFRWGKSTNSSGHGT